MTADSGSKNCVKYIIVILNIPILLFGAVAIGLAVWITVDDPSFVALTHLDEISVIDHSYVLHGSYVIIAGGAAIFVFGIMGIVAACTGSPCLLGFYAALLSLAMCIEIAGTVLGIIFKTTWEKHLEKAIARSIKEEYDGIPNSMNYFTKHFDNVQTSLQCCGFNNVSDYENAENWNKTQDSGLMALVPAVCCKSFTIQSSNLTGDNSTDNSTSTSSIKADCQSNPTDENSYTIPCKDAFEDMFELYQAVIIGVAAALVFCQLVMMTLALCMLCFKADNSYTFKGE